LNADFKIGTDFNLNSVGFDIGNRGGGSVQGSNNIGVESATNVHNLNQYLH
jgi:hypothetical protein